ncbi:hypothetical protein NT6N_24520 [Oceaniferula spumae]|uniref:Uncharacterized protein n=1 Tax=Oceaniferula spumae TaxID=2979115 RepID=A0AAT9FNC5_9BACT
MGNSYVTFQNLSFRSRDTLLELWLRLLALNLPDDQYKPKTWIHELRNEWLFQASGLWNGVISPQLDKFCTTQERIEVVLATSNRLMVRLKACGDVVGSRELGLLGLGSFEVDYPVHYFEQMHERFEALLLGQPLPPTPKVIPGPPE